MKVIDDRVAYGNFEWKILKLYGIVCAIYQLSLIVLMGMCSKIANGELEINEKFAFNNSFLG